MEIGYGTYGMPKVPLRTALPGLAERGYRSVELCVAAPYEPAPDRLDGAARAALRGLIQDLHMTLSGLMVFVNLLAEHPDEFERQETLFRKVCVLAGDLSQSPESRIVASTIGHGTLTWEQDEPELVRRVARFAEIADQEACRFALEPHVGGILSDPERAAWLVEAGRQQSEGAARALGLNFDISHFTVAGYPLKETIRTLVPYSWHTHVKDGYMMDGRVQFQLPGEGDTDYVQYFRTMAECGWSGPITVEISAQIFNRDDYEPWGAAEYCLRKLHEAQAEALGIA